ncbi:putative defense protein Hdd11-like [Ruditapes philippinarum]|uniref:putative defense protein Hdd11-like n=1 Tax=Ruditapes philippinarum TaxID=129788 RepID=UPI00295AF15E|nr:putative defense protein Hdd11-like [Ruditapes philippinarum]
MILSTCLVVSLFILGSNSSPNGAPPGSCSSMIPSPNHHASTPRTTPCPYTIETTPNTFTCGSTVSVTLGKISTATPGFRGFLCQARTNVDDYSTVTGTLTDTDNAVLSTNRCPAVNASITHAERSVKDSFTFDWTNDGTSATTNSVYIVCTLVQSKTIFWVNMTTPALTYTGTATTC